MPYLIRYFRAGREQGSTPWDGSLEIMQKIAADGIMRHGMDRAVIADAKGAIVWSSDDAGTDERRSQRRRAGFRLKWMKRHAA